MIAECVAMEAPGVNKKFLVHDSGNNPMVHKIHQDPSPADAGEREDITFAIGSALGVPINKVVSIEDGSIYSPYIPEGNLHDALPEFSSIDSDLVNSAFAFYNWIGEVDRGTEDVLIDGSGLLFIDHGLSGPNSREFRSSHPLEHEFSVEDLIIMSFPGKQSFFREATKLGFTPSRRSPAIVRDIESFAKHKLPGIAREYKLLDRNGDEFTEEYVEILQARAQNARANYRRSSKAFKKLVRANS